MQKTAASGLKERQNSDQFCLQGQQSLKHLPHSLTQMTKSHIFTFWKTGLLLLTSSTFTTTWAVLVREWGPPEALSSVAVT